MVKETLTQELAVTLDGLMLLAGQKTIEAQTHPGTDLDTAVPASVTRYWYLGRLEKAGVLIRGSIRAHAAGVGATTTLDILKVASGTDVASGTTLVTQVATNGLTADTDYALTITASAAAIAAGSVIVAKTVTQGVETLTPILTQLVFNY